jgi:hypothetical protein
MLGIGERALKWAQEQKAAKAAPAKPEVAKVANATEAKATEVATEAKATEVATEAKADATEATTEAKTEEVADKPLAEEKISENDYAKRMAKLTNASKKLAQEKQAFAKERERLTYLENIMTKAQAGAKEDPVGFVQRNLGITPEEYTHAWLKSQGYSSKQIQEAKEQGLTQEQIRAIAKEEVSRSSKEYEERATNQQALDYRNNVLTPLLADKTKFPLIQHELGTEAPQRLYDTMLDRWHKASALPEDYKSPEGLTKAQLIEQARDHNFMANLIEKHFRQKAEEYNKLLAGQTTSNDTKAKPTVASQAKNNEASTVATSNTPFWQPRKMTYTATPKK